MMLIPKDRLDVFETCVITLGGSWSPRNGEIRVVFTLGDSVFTVHNTPGAVFDVRSSDVQALAQVRSQWESALRQLSQQAQKEENETGT